MLALLWCGPRLIPRLLIVSTRLLRISALLGLVLRLPRWLMVVLRLPRWLILKLRPILRTAVHVAAVVVE